jgi:hypothetical protein
MERYVQALVLLNDAIMLMEDADDTLVVALLSDPRDLIAAKAGRTAVRAN